MQNHRLHINEYGKRVEDIKLHEFLDLLAGLWTSGRFGLEHQTESISDSKTVFKKLNALWKRTNKSIT